MHNNNYCWMNKYMDNKQCSLNQITVSFCQSQNKSWCFCCFGKFSQNTQDVLAAAASQLLPCAVCQSESDYMKSPVADFLHQRLGDVHWGLALSLFYSPLDRAFFSSLCGYELSTLQEIVKDRGAWLVAVHGVSESDKT